MTITIKTIANQIANKLNAEIGVSVDVTCRGTGKWTISGRHTDAIDAACWLIDKGLMTEESNVHDAEIGETFVYMTS